jgi:hypothetical protein
MVLLIVLCLISFTNTDSETPQQQYEEYKKEE